MMFFLAMVHNREAIGILDWVMGREGLPNFSDRGDLPYVKAVVGEFIRWNPPLPIGVPGRVTRGGIYRRYFIPAGAIVIQRVWAVSVI